MIRFSIVIPVYNVAPYLRECLDSVLAQTYDSWEVICVDDGSSDGSSEILDEYAGRDARIRLLHQQNAGVSVARNVALEVVRGEWIVFVDADDILRRECLGVLDAAVNHCPALDAVLYGYKSFPDGDLAALRWNDAAEAGGRWTSSCRQITCSLLGYNVWRVAMKRSLVGEIRFKPYVVGEDILFLYSCAVKADRLGAVDQELYGYRMRSGSAINSAMTVRKYRDTIGFQLDLFELVRNCPGKFDQRFVHIALNRLLEGGYAALMQLPTDARTEMHVIWRQALPKLIAVPFMTTFQRIRLFLLIHFSRRIVERVLLALPFALKQRGIRR